LGQEIWKHNFKMIRHNAITSLYLPPVTVATSGLMPI